jgi:hypothetical protein
MALALLVACFTTSDALLVSHPNLLKPVSPFFVQRSISNPGHINLSPAKVKQW